MPTFETPEPIWVDLDVPVGDIRITATDRTDTVVRITPSDPSSDTDVRSAHQTVVDLATGRLLIKAPKQRGLGLFGKIGSVDVTVDLPTGSRLQGDTAVANVRCTGRLGDCRLKTATGDLRMERTGALDLRTAAGSVDVDGVDGNADVSTGSGRLRLGEVNGNATVKNSNGDCSVGEVTGDLRVKTANGAITIGHAERDVSAHTAMGDIRIGDLVRGLTSLKTAYGQIEIGVHAGTAALLDVATHFGRVRNELNATDGPAPTEEKLEVQARTSMGDIVIHRA